MSTEKSTEKSTPPGGPEEPTKKKGVGVRAGFRAMEQMERRSKRLSKEGALDTLGLDEPFETLFEEEEEVEGGTEDQTDNRNSEPQCEWVKEALVKVQIKYGGTLKTIKELDTRRKLIEFQPAKNLEISRRFKATDVPKGTELKIRRMYPYPFQTRPIRLIFELEERRKEYQQMEEVISWYYRTTKSIVPITTKNVQKGLCGVLKRDEGHKYSRIRILKGQVGKANCFLEYVDYNSKRWVNLTTEKIYLLHKGFARLPPRATDLQLEGLDHFEDRLVSMVVHDYGDNGMLEGVLTAEVQPSNKIVVWNEKYPRDMCQYGINFKLFAYSILRLQKQYKLPPVGYHVPCVFVVNADEEGNIDVHLNTPLSRYFNELVNSLDPAAILAKRGRIKKAEIDVVYLAPSAVDGVYYRCVVPKDCEEILAALKGGKDEKVPVRFVDYGNKEEVAIEDLVLAEDVHLVLKHFPKLGLHCHLDNVWALDSAKYMQLYHSRDQPYVLHVVKEAENGIPPMVILKVEGEKGCVNHELKEDDLVEYIDPYYKYDEVPDRGPVMEKRWSRKTQDEMDDRRIE